MNLGEIHHDYYLVINELKYTVASKKARQETRGSIMLIGRLKLNLPVKSVLLG